MTIYQWAFPELGAERAELVGTIIEAARQEERDGLVREPERHHHDVRAARVDAGFDVVDAPLA